MTRLVLFIIVLIVNPIVAFADTETERPDMTPCLKTVTLNERIIRLEVPMTPFRGLNLIFPFKLHDNLAVYSMSSNIIWNYKQAAGSNIVPVYFARFSDGMWGTSADFLISQDDFIFSLTLVASQTGHCSNYQFVLSGALKEEMEQEKKQLNRVAFDSVYQKKLDEVDQKVSNQVLDVIGNIVSSKKITTRIHEESSLDMDGKKNAIVLYVTKIERHGAFNVLYAEIDNKLPGRKDLQISQVDVVLDGESTPVVGKSDFLKRLLGGESAPILFSTLTELPKTGATLRAITNNGTVEVSW